MHDPRVGVARPRLQSGGDRRFGGVKMTHVGNPNFKRLDNVGLMGEQTLADGMIRAAVTKGQPFAVN